MSERTRCLRWLDRLPIQWRLASASALLTGLILLVFALVIGGFTTQRIRRDFETQTGARFGLLQQQLSATYRGDFTSGDFQLRTRLRDVKGDPGTIIAVYGPVSEGGGAHALRPLGSSDPRVSLGIPVPNATQRIGDFRVEARLVSVPVFSPDGSPLQLTTGSQATTPLLVQIGRSYTSLERTTRRVWTLLSVGTLVGTLLALLAGLAVGRRAMIPVRRMTSTARHIARTRDLEAKMPEPLVDDEIAELARTLQDMIDELAAAQARVDHSLQQQRVFVADASHELRTPLTSVQANLELLTLSTAGDDREAAESALRSSRRMGRLVSDLLLLARMDARREAPLEAIDLDRVVLEAADELEPQLGDHELVLDLEPVSVDGARDELLRVVANLVGNALSHTPDGTETRVRLSLADGVAELVVEDDGPGIPDDLRDRVFDRFVRRGGEGAGSTGIGLAIVRAAARRHGGDVRLEATSADGGARFVVTLAGRAPHRAPEGEDGATAPVAIPDDRTDGPLRATRRRAAQRIQRRLAGPRGSRGAPPPPGPGPGPGPDRFA